MVLGRQESGIVNDDIRMVSNMFMNNQTQKKSPYIHCVKKCIFGKFNNFTLFLGIF